MKDIDFDELDKAVNSLMSNVSSPQPTQDSPAATANAASAVLPTDADKAVVVTPSAPPAPQTVSATPSPSVSSSSAAAPAAATPAGRPTAPAARRGGRFMDMVHTSSDMTPRPAPSREGISVAPPRTAPGRSSSQSQAQSPVVESAPAPQTATSAPESMPDPIDVGLNAAASTVESLDQATDTTTASVAPNESPFIADAKVEKRPLNAKPVVETPPFDLMKEVAAAQPTADTESKRGEDEPPVNPQVPELNSDLVAIESADVANMTQTVDTNEVISQVAEPAVPLGAASIPQQYTAHESTGDKSHAAIYDASQYPEPVVHPAKHRSSWWWVLWVLLLLGAGAGGALLLYGLGIIP